MLYVRKIMSMNYNIKKKKELYKKLKQLRKVFNNEALELCKEKFKMKAVYLYIIAKVFV